jgi:hypothetical protein
MTTLSVIYPLYSYTTLDTMDGPEFSRRYFAVEILQSVSEFWTVIRYTVFPISDRHTPQFHPEVRQRKPVQIPLAP